MKLSTQILLLLLVATSGLEASISQEQLSDCLDSQNKYRRQHGAPDLELDDALNSKAQKWADDIGGRGVQEHSGDKSVGENLAWNGNFSTPCSTMVKSWYDENKDYDYQNGGFSQATGHFTQLVWIATKKVGCGMAKRSNDGGVALVCNYSPAGNTNGQFQDNVKPVQGARGS